MRTLKATLCCALLGFLVKDVSSICSSPEVNNFGTFSPQSTNYSLGSIVDYECNEGYQLHGNTSRKCLQSGLWSGAVPYCWASNSSVVPFLYCKRPHGIENGQIQPLNETRFSFNDMITIVCNDGYCMEGNPTSTCRIYWTPPPVCRRCSGCRRPNDPQFGSVHSEVEDQTEFAIDEWVIYRCDEGYSLDGDSSVYCRSNGWTHEPTCKRGCSRPDNPQYGSVHSDVEDQTLFALNESVLYRCNEGYSLQGNSAVHCTSDGWSHTPTCISGCRRPQDPQFGSVHSEVEDQTEFAIDEWVIYRCDEGYFLDGDSSVYCRNNGWTHEPTCKRSCGKPSAPANGFVTSPVVFLARLYAQETYMTNVCNEGYCIVGDPKILCTANGWSPSPTCRRCCPPRENPSSGRKRDQPKGLFVGTRMSYACGPGNYLDGSPISRCQEDGTWDYDVPSCRSGCRRPNDPQFGSVHSEVEDQTEFAIDEWVIYRCDEGYSLDGDSSVYCRSDGWTHEPTCKRKCSRPDNPQHGSVHSDVENQILFNVDEWVIYRCNEGYSLLGNSSVYCRNDGWTSIPTCIRFCNKPSDLENGYLIIPHSRKQRFLTNEAVVYFCNVGYRRAGPRRVYCRSNGWSHAPACMKTATCSPQNIRNGYHLPRDKSAWNPRQEVTYHCNDDYVLVGEAAFVCQDDGSWSGNSLPTCRPINCGKPTAPDNGYLVAPAMFLPRLFSLNTYMTTVCYDGFCLAGDSKTHCLRTGWSTFPSCERCCPERDPPASGGVDTSRNQPTTSPSSVGSTIRYTCNTGYNLVGSATARCLESGNWDFDVPTCSKAEIVQSCQGRCGSTGGGGCNCNQACFRQSNNNCCDDVKQYCFHLASQFPTSRNIVRQNLFPPNFLTIQDPYYLRRRRRRR